MKLNTVTAIIQLGRFPFLVGGFLLFSVGMLLAMLSGASFDARRFMFGYAILFTAQLSLSYSNNYFDVETDRFNKSTFVSGGSKLLIERPELRVFCKWFSLALSVLSVLFSIVFTFTYDYSWFFVLFVLSGNLLGWYYAAPPVRLAYHGLGEVATAITYGILMPGIGYLTFLPMFESIFVAFVIPLLCYGLFFIITVELPDVEGDRQGGKHTFVVRVGRRHGLHVALIAVGLSAIYFIVGPYLFFSNNTVNFAVVSVLSLIPFIAGLSGVLQKRMDSRIATMIAYTNMAALIIFMISLNGYLLSLV